MTAAVDTTTFDLGDGAPIVCEGFGTPLPASRRNDTAQGPCGHTFHDVDDVGRTSFSVTATWSVTWRTSAGTSGAQPDIVTTTVVPYRVREIQTVGASG